jgi:Domain of unknown function (DUF4350)
MRRRRSPWVVAGLLVALVVGVNLGLRELDKRTRSPGGPSSSSFATAPDGAAAFAELLQRFGRPVVQLRDEPSEAPLDPRATLVLLDPAYPLTGDDAAAVRLFVERGGRLLAGGESTGWLENIVDRPPAWKPSTLQTAEAVGVPGVGSVQTAGQGAWVSPEGHVLVRARDDVVAVEQKLGEGTVVLLADPSPLQNGLLARADNAALGLALAGDRPVAFAESVHGYGPASGLGAIPTRWWWAFGGLLLAALVLALARGRRFGPPERESRDLPPARVEFAEALATQLAKAPREDGVRTARRVARARVARRLALPATAADEELRSRARAKGVDAAVVDAVIAETATESDLLAVGRALRTIEREEALA